MNQPSTEEPHSSDTANLPSKEDSKQATELESQSLEGISDSELPTKPKDSTSSEQVPLASSTPRKTFSSDNTSKAADAESITEQDILELQTLKPGEEHPDGNNHHTILNEELSVSRIDLNSRDPQTSSVTGLPSNTEKLQIPEEEVPLLKELTAKPSTSSDQNGEMGIGSSKKVESTTPKQIMSENPELPGNRVKIQESDITGNCRPWSDHVYYKLFLDTMGRNANLMVMKCEISYVDVFTDQERSLYKSRFIGGKAEGITQLFVFDLMKSSWEDKIPLSHAIELNVDIVMSSSPNHQCAETLLSLLQLEKAYLKHLRFDGQLNVMLRFSHAYGWDVKDDQVRERVHEGLRNLHREGVNLEALSADSILEEMRVDGILVTDEERVKHYVGKRHAWKSILPKNSASQSNLNKAGTSKQAVIDYNYGDIGRDVPTTSSNVSENLASMTDSYYVDQHSWLWNIIQDTKRNRGVFDETIDDA